MTAPAPATCPVYDAASVAKPLGVAYTREEIARFGSPPQPLDGYLTFFDPGLSILQLRETVQPKGVVYPTPGIAKNPSQC